MTTAGKRGRQQWRKGNVGGMRGNYEGRTEGRKQGRNLGKNNGKNQEEHRKTIRKKFREKKGKQQEKQLKKYDEKTTVDIDLIQDSTTWCHRRYQEANDNKTNPDKPGKNGDATATIGTMPQSATVFFTRDFEN